MDDKCPHENALYDRIRELLKERKTHVNGISSTCDVRLPLFFVWVLGQLNTYSHKWSARFGVGGIYCIRA